MVPWEGYVSDETMGTFAPIVLYWVYAGGYQLILHRRPLERYRLHTRAEEEEKNLVGLPTVVRGVLLQQLVQAIVAMILFMAGRLAAAPGFQELDGQASADHPTEEARGPSSNSINLPADLRSPEGGVVPATNMEFSTPKPEAQASAEPAMPTEEEVTEALYSQHRGHRRLPIFRDICPE
ncbi:hypothetical protein BAE44_0025408 [Dichanthelium oligosanthes]|uniref:Uncharacterized protein n=1 Tax=Dichanthelium oligosanthes TaxID=888268 RepID=A0A1E5UL14_9POAL|nr:hypothetical protein BAE44_0025408 [Dichanthelium oligosanthes]